jgi:predicted metal-dependent phosphoesterase TrpH
LTDGGPEGAVSRVDLHLHSTASDGRLTPPELVAKATGLGLEIIALTDHDTIDGVPEALEAAGEFPGLKLIPGVEISTDLPEGEAHVLGYFIDFTSDALASQLKRFRDSRQGRARGMIEKLAEMGLPVAWERVRELAGEGSIGRPHIARAMLEKGYIETFEEAFDNYIGHGGPAYVPREKMTPAEAVALILGARGLPVLAHPFTVADPAEMVKDLKPAGLVGLEVYYKDYSEAQIGELLELADKYGLITTGGTDYHGIGSSGEVMLGGTEVPLACAERLIALADSRCRKLANM